MPPLINQNDNGSLQTVSRSALKWAAMISMACDHIGAVFFPTIFAFRLVGRLAFPIYCYLIVNGFFYTRSYPKYLARMITFALLSQLPFAMVHLAESRLPLWNLFTTGWQTFLTPLNSLFVLSLGLISLFVVEKLRCRFGGKGHLMGLVFCGGMTVLSYLLQCDYAFLGIPLQVCFYEGVLLSRRWEHRLLCARLTTLGLATAALCLYLLLRITIYHTVAYNTLLLGSFQFLALVLLTFASNQKEKRRPVLQYGFYLFYPAHLLLLSLLAQWVPPFS